MNKQTQKDSFVTFEYLGCFVTSSNLSGLALMSKSWEFWFLTDWGEGPRGYDDLSPLLYSSVRKYLEFVQPSLDLKSFMKQTLRKEQECCLSPLHRGEHCRLHSWLQVSLRQLESEMLGWTASEVLGWMELGIFILSFLCSWVLILFVFILCSSGACHPAAK